MQLIILNILILFLLFLVMVAIILDILRRKHSVAYQNKQMLMAIDPKTVYELINKNSREYQLIDVRSPKEFSRKHIKNAINMSVMDLNYIKFLKKLNKQQKYIIYGQRDSRSQRAFYIMKKHKFKEVYIMNGGMLEWDMQDLPTEK
ncbi:MAG: rhodanese-like domain-containing protein [Candidatus Margulisbacteria bacterium]|nr:rhodanese-like domain-containing protein [Candidatus Margulisiibacteriota bacterium]